MRSAINIGGKIRARYIESLKSGYAFKVRPYIIQQLQPIFVAGMTAAHLSGYRRLFLIKRQTPNLIKKMVEAAAKEKISLSALDDALQVLQRRASLNIDKLQEQYNTQALKVLNDVSRDIEIELDKTILNLVESGAHITEAKRALADKFDELGLSPRKPYQLETIFRTQLQMGFAAGRYQAEQAPEIQEILWGYKYVTTGDDRVREEHAILEGTTLPKSDPFWQRFYPPNGWNCRCQVIPLFEEREIKPPPLVDNNGDPIAPDKGFDFNPGEVFTATAPPTVPPITVPEIKPAKPKSDFEIAKSIANTNRPDLLAAENALNDARARVEEIIKRRESLPDFDPRGDAIFEEFRAARSIRTEKVREYSAAIDLNRESTINVISAISPADRQGLYHAGATSKEFNAELDKAYADTPKSIREFVNNAGIKIITVDVSVDASPGLDSESPRGHVPGAHWRGLEGFYSPSDKRCVIAEQREIGYLQEGNGPRISEYEKTDRSRGVYFHEFGHALDHAIGINAQGIRASDTKEFRDAYRGDVAIIRDKIANGDERTKNAAERSEYFLQQSTGIDEKTKFLDAYTESRVALVKQGEKISNFVRDWQGDGSPFDTPTFKRLKATQRDLNEASEIAAQKVFSDAPLNDGTTSGGRSEAFAELAAIVLDGKGCAEFNVDNMKMLFPSTLSHIKGVIKGINE